MRSLRQKLTIQTFTTSDDGLQAVKTWADDSTVTGTVSPISRVERQHLGLNLEEAAFSVVLPKGLALDAQANRLQTADDATWTILEVQENPFNSVAIVREVR